MSQSGNLHIRHTCVIDISKAVRMDYGNQSLYLRLMLEALPLWDAWNKERATQGQIPVYHETGVLIFGRHGQFSQYEQESIRLIQEAGYGHVLQIFDSPQSIIKRFPYFKDAVANGYDTAYLNTRGGMLYTYTLAISPIHIVYWMYRMVQFQ